MHCLAARRRAAAWWGVLWRWSALAALCVADAFDELAAQATHAVPVRFGLAAADIAEFSKHKFHEVARVRSSTTQRSRIQLLNVVGSNVAVDVAVVVVVVVVVVNAEEPTRGVCCFGCTEKRARLSAQETTGGGGGGGRRRRQAWFLACCGSFWLLVSFVFFRTLWSLLCLWSLFSRLWSLAFVIVTVCLSFVVALLGLWIG
jgi:hypothetical protein